MTLTNVADGVTVITALTALYAYGEYRWTLWDRTKRLERLLATKDQPGDDKLELHQLAATLMLTEDQVIEAAQRSKKVKSHEGNTLQYCFTIPRKQTGSA